MTTHPFGRLIRLPVVDEVPYLGRGATKRFLPIHTHALGTSVVFLPHPTEVDQSIVFYGSMKFDIALPYNVVEDYAREADGGLVPMVIPVMPPGAAHTKHSKVSECLVTGRSPFFGTVLD
jgi:hypothetical protein